MADDDWLDCQRRNLVWSVLKDGEVTLYQPGRPGKTAVASTLKLAYLKLTGKR